MNKAILRLNLFLTFILILAVSCKNKTSTPIPTGPSIQVIEEPEIALPVEASTSSDDFITVRAKFTTVGPLMPNPIYLTQEITYKNGKVIWEKSATKTSGLDMNVIQEYDDKSRLTSLISEQNGERSVYQINEYTDDDLLLSELRIEKSSTGYDTTIYKYHYPEDRPNPMHYYRTNNGTKVTEMTLTTDGNKEILEERAFGSSDYIGISITTRTKNKDGKVVKEQQTSISSDWQDKSKIDTTKYEPTFYDYDNKGRLIKQQSQSILSVNGVVQNFYSEDGIIQKKIIAKTGKPKQTVVFKRV